MGISQYLSKFALGVNSQGVLSAAKGGTGTTSGGGNSSPTISAITYPGNDTAISLAGGDTITLTGTNFGVGVNVIINGVSASVVTRISATQLTFTAPAQSTGSYIVYVVNTDGSTALAVPGLQYSATPSWTTAAGSLGNTIKQTSFSTTLVATGDAPITYSVVSGTLPSGITLNSSTGVLSGTTPDVLSSTTYNFTVRSTDAQNQDTDRAFSLTVIPSNPTAVVEYLVVAGAGAGASFGGGGGAGGFRTATGFAVTAGSPITVTVGAGGAGASFVSNTTANQGSDSVFSTITSVGGGGGANRNDATSPASGRAGGSGGSGGGGSPADGGTAGAGGSGTAGQGNAGGSGPGAGTYGWGGGGGGGAAVVGGNGSFNVGGSGGNGTSSSISGTSTYYAGGGGGGSYNGNPNGSGGLGGGGSGSAGTANTGGGGGGGQLLGPGASGGSGIVIIRYSDIYDAASSTTGSPTVTVAGGYRVYKWTSSGSITF